MLMRTPIPLIFLLSAWLWSSTAQALLEIHITQGVEGGIPVAVVPFEWTGSGAAPAEDISRIVSDDLSRSGKFELKDPSDFLETPHHGSEVDFEKWRAIGVENLVVGRIKPNPSGGYLVQFQLFDIFKPGSLSPDQPTYRLKQLAGYNLPTTAQRLRDTAHFISDVIYEKLTGERGAFSTRIAYVTATRGEGGDERYSLQVSDYDGHNEFEVLGSPKPVMSPTWSPDGRQLAYVSFEQGRSAVYVQDLSTTTPRKMADFRGINGAPAWSPDGRQLALTLSRDDPGNTEIYVMEVATGNLRRITYNRAIDTEPAWSPDGRTLVFTSDRSGGPQLYRVPAQGGRAERLTFEGNYNARGTFSPDGKLLAMVHSSGNGFRVGVLDLENRSLRVLTEGPLDEAPTFAPNGSMILYATGHRQRGELAAVSVDGGVRARLRLQQGNVREPAWGPFLNQSKERQ